MSFGVALLGCNGASIPGRGAKGGHRLGGRPLKTALYFSRKHGPTHPSLWDPSHNAVLPLGCKVGDASPSSTNVPDEIAFLGVGCVAPSPFKQLMWISDS